MRVEQVKRAFARSGSIRGAAKLLGMSHTSLQWWLLKNGYDVVRTATLRKRRTPARADHAPTGEAGGSGGR